MLGAGEACEEDCTKSVHRPSKRNRQQRRCALIAILDYFSIFRSIPTRKHKLRQSRLVNIVALTITFLFLLL